MNRTAAPLSRSSTTKRVRAGFVLLATCLLTAGSTIPLAANAAERRVTKYDGTGIVQIAQQYLGAPYQYGGNSPNGFDCSGFTSYVYKKAGYGLPRATTAQYGKLNPVRVPEIGDLVFFRTAGSTISHVGIYVGEYQFIHAPSSGKSVSYADIRNSYWKPRYAGSRTIFRGSQRL